MDQSQREIQAALHPARVAADPAIGRLGQANPLEQRLGAPAAVVARQALERGLEDEMLAAGEDRVERSFLERGPNRRPDLAALADDVEAADRGATAGRRQQCGQHQHRRRLAGAVGAEKAVDLAGRHRQVDAVDGARALAELAHQVLHLDRGWLRHLGQL